MFTLLRLFWVNILPQQVPYDGSVDENFKVVRKKEKKEKKELREEKAVRHQRRQVFESKL